MSERKQPEQPVGRRTMLAGAGTVGALAAAATVLPLTQQAPADAKAPGQQPLDGEGGYRLTEHIKRYYRSTRI